MFIAYQATNVSVAFMSIFLAYDKEDEYEQYLTVLGILFIIDLNILYRMLIVER